MVGRQTLNLLIYVRIVASDHVKENEKRHEENKRLLHGTFYKGSYFWHGEVQMNKRKRTPPLLNPLLQVALQLEKR